MGPAVLEDILRFLPKVNEPRVLVGHDTSDDAGVFIIDDQRALVQTVDFFSPIVDDPYLFGQIAAANSLSDIYAMGATPLSALNIACFPSCLTVSEMGQIIKGGADKLLEAGAVLLGGHTVDNPEPKFGLAVTGIVHPDEIWRNRGIQPGDLLFLTKPLGSGIIATALKRGALPEEYEQIAVDAMATLNKAPWQVLRQYKATVHACTDVTGFGFLGHLSEMVQGGGCSVTVFADALPLLPGALDFAVKKFVPGGTNRNREFFGKHTSFAANVPAVYQTLMFDAQTSGGLLVAVPEGEADGLIKAMSAAGVAATIVAAASAEIENCPIKVVFEGKKTPCQQ